MTSRTIAWLFSLLSLVSAVGYFLWISQGTATSATEANLYPAPVLERIASQLAAAAPPLDWNIPWLSIAVWLAWLFTVLTIGIAIQVLLKTQSEDSKASASVVTAFGAGFVVVSLVQFVTGSVGLAKIPILLPLLIVGLGSLALPAVRRALFRTPQAAAWQWRRLSTPGKALCILAAVAFSLLLIPALTPPVQSDGVRYHLGAVQEYIKAGRIGYLPSNAYSNMPFLVEMHFMAALTCNAPEASQLMHLTLAIFTSLGIYALCSSLASPSTFFRTSLIPLLAAVLYLGTPMSAVLATWPFTDHGISFFLVASALALTRSSAGFSRGNALMLGLLLGGLIGTKYTMVPIAGALLFVPWLALRFDKSEVKPHRFPLKYTAIAAVISALIGGIWFIKNLLLTGNPFYPLASQLFPAGEWTAEANQFLHSRAGAKGMGKGLLQLLMSPWNATFHWLRFESHNPGPTLLLGSLATIAAALAVKASPRRGTLTGLLLIILLSYLIWFFSYQANRLLLPTLALMLAVTPAWLFSQDNTRFAVRLSIALAMAAAYGLAWALQWSLITTGLTPPPLPYLLGNQYREAYIATSLTNARAYEYLNRNVRPNERVLLVGEHRIYGAEFPAVWSDWFDTPILAHIIREQKITSMQQLLDYFKSQNIRWVMINEAELAPQLEDSFKPRFKPAEWQLFEELRTLESPTVKTTTIPPGVTIKQLDLDE